MTRRESREQAFIIVFEKMFQQECTVDEISDAAEECGLFERDGFALQIANAVYDNLEAIDATIVPCLKGWKANRISKVANSILRMSVAEMTYIDGIPESVTINEAVELAKKFSTPDDASFVNGVLATINRARQAQKAEAEKQLAEQQAAEPQQLKMDI